MDVATDRLPFASESILFYWIGASPGTGTTKLILPIPLLAEYRRGFIEDKNPERKTIDSLEFQNILSIDPRLRP